MCVRGRRSHDPPWPTAKNAGLVAVVVVVVGLAVEEEEAGVVAQVVEVAERGFQTGGGVW